MRNFLFLSVFLAFAAPVFSQVYLGASVSPGGFAGGKNAPRPGKGPNSFESNLAVYLSTSAAYEVFGSTSPESQLLKYSAKGFYRTELVYLVLMAHEKKEKFEKLAGRVQKGETLAELSADYGYDLIENFPRAEGIKEELEKISDDDIERLHDILINKPPAIEPE